MSIDHLSSLDPIFAESLRVGGPTVRDFRRPGGFSGLLCLIIEQQLSTTVAAALWAKLQGMVGVVTPDAILALPDEDLRACGLSRQKIGYARGLARTVADGGLDFDAIHGMDDEEAIAALVALKGIGRWTAEIYLMMAMERPDIWPVGDLAIQLGVQRLKGWAEKPTPAQLLAVAEPWRPHRSLAAKLVWHHYVALQEQAKAMKTPKGKKTPKEKERL
ncbi:DNA-3-methyladenine glycosylase family protein [Azospirillum isscasi]|uniref:DNA-3-methyladenine glycosylase II n=1 Tax=Azospirillum isscasi TaxID=3053926 RepID=A0ABU0WBE6_9PROT|nr:DNA-3-methyladenine glycosylase 2 family protein [Azospirillum isscasi]MDQ2101502.1 DNA-3-methyladenine glycosylase 2 family protein [Azospirillum isscasi]